MVEMDADLSHDPAVLPELLSAVEQGADLAIGSRYVPGGSIPDWNWLRRAISRGGGLYARSVLGLSVHDATAGFRAYHRDNLSHIDLDRVRADGYGFQVEMTYLTEGNGGRIVEVPITFRDRSLGRSKMSGRIVVEALVLVTWWGVRDRVRKVFRARH
jgi:glycosyltransferase involved in cell wall biosynthesis